MAKKKAKKGDSEPLTVASKVKAFVRGNGMMSSKDFLVALNGAVAEIISKAVTRARENKRSTLQPRDL